MSKVVAFIGSPRKKGCSTQLLEQVIAGAKEAGADVVTYNLNDEGVKGCQGCGYCRSNEGCATKDKLQPMYDDIKSADGIVVSFPNYFGNPGGQSKLWIDRLYPFMAGDFSPRSPGKKIVTIFAQANPDKELYKNMMDGINGIFKMLGWELSHMLHSIGGDPKTSVTQELMDEALEAGKKLVQ